MPGMSRRAGLVIAATFALAAAVAGGASQDGEDPLSVGRGPPPAPPRPDPAASRPAYVAGFEAQRSLLLDRAGRVVRVLPRSAGAGAQACPGGSRLVDDASWGDVRVRRLDGTTLWRRRIPSGDDSHLECLDPRGRRIAVVTEPELRPGYTLRIVSRAGSRAVLRYRTASPLLTATRLYVTDPAGVKTYSVPSGRLVHQLAAPASAHRVLPSPDGRWMALTHLTEALRDGSFLADLQTGEVRPIAIPRMTLLGWVDDDRLAVRSDRRLRILDTTLREHPVVPGFRPQSALVTRRGDIVATDGRTLVTVRRGAGRVERVGTVPEGTWLVDSLLDIP
jgi:hypothetical protein